MYKDKKPLYRKLNKKALNFWGDTGGEFRHIRHTKVFKENPAHHMSILQGKQRGVDYTPLFKFLLSKIGQNWDKVYSEAVSRLDTNKPIFYMVNIHSKSTKAYVNIGENSSWSTLYVDEDSLLQKCYPELTINDMQASCNCCTHTLNGQVITNPLVIK